MRELVRYIHLNPVRAGIVPDLKTLRTYQRSGHAAIMGRVKNDRQDTDYVLAYFGKNEAVARKGYEIFVSEGVSKGRRPDLVGGGLVRSIGGWSALRDLRETNTRVVSDERILGSSDFAESVLKGANEAYEKRTEAAVKGLGIDQVIATVAEYLGLDSKLIGKKTKQRAIVLSRSIICALSVDRLMLTGVDIARRLNMTPSAVSRLVARGREETVLPKIERRLFGE